MMQGDEGMMRTTGDLSDPEDRPEEDVADATVVLGVTQGAQSSRVHEQPKSRQFYMPVWGEDELLKCRGDVFTHVREVGCVPRAR